jgi:hypothetical protein
MKQLDLVPYNNYNFKNNNIMKETPKGKSRLTTQEKQTILSLRLQRFSIQQIADMTGRSTMSVKRVIYNLN